MKITDTTLEVTRSGQFQERGFAIASNSKAFDILSSKIYTNVPLAIVRELSTNASDSHTDAGCPEKPFDVHLPNALEPWLSIRDHGTGLSPEAVETVYTTYFKSTRSGSDDFTGCLGLGSKSPFAYTDQFTIVSVFNGQKYTYSAFKNESSVPSLALLSTVPTDEPNGLEINISIKPGDAQAFIKAAQRVYTFFKVRPNIVGAQINFDDLKPEIMTPEFSLYSNGWNVLTSRVNVIMGQVCYAVDPYKVDEPFGHNAIVTLNMPMGSVSIAASREEIHYDDKTVHNVSAALRAAGESARIELESRVQNETTLMSKLRALSKYRNLVQGLSVQGTTHIESAEKDKYALKECMIRRGDKLFIHMYGADLRPGEYMDHLIFIEDDADLTQNMKNRLRQFMHKNCRVNSTKVFLATIKDVARFEEVFGPVTTKLSLLPDVPRVPRDSSRTSSRSKPIKLLKDNHHDNMSFDWENINDAANIDATDACCVPRDGNWIIWNGSKQRPSVVRKLANVLGFKRVYGIAEKRYESLLKKHGLVELSVVAKDRAEKLIAGLDVYALANFQNDYVDNRIPVEKFAGLSPECDNIIKMRKAKIDNISVYEDLCKTFDIKMPTAPDYQKAFFEKYPILLAINWYSSTITTEVLTDYIKMVEATQQ